eukprot:GHVS01104237.1.p1 GENE.GHVS01104237.1~~GHVS01104237.1.p1  ORF type:complete len:254 (+),score=37.23 GHVS01104237.1:129-890(+)
MASRARSDTALIVVDVQNDFILPSGALSVKEAELIIDHIHSLRELSSIDHVVFTQDWHPMDHISFATNHSPTVDEGSCIYVDEPKSTELPVASSSTGVVTHKGVCNDATTPPTGCVSLNVWPNHCVNDTKGAQLHSRLLRRATDKIIQKGVYQHIESLSGFGDVPEDTGLLEWLNSKNVEKVVVVGVATDICMGKTALDANGKGFNCYVVLDASAGVDKENTDAMIKQFRRNGVFVMNTVDDLKKALNPSHIL